MAVAFSELLAGEQAENFNVMHQVKLQQHTSVEEHNLLC